MVKSVHKQFEFRCALLGSLIFLSICQPIAANTITDGDKAEVIRMTLERAVLAKEIADMKDNTNVVLSSENFDPSWIPQFPGVNITLLTPEEIQAKADREGDYLYLRFGEMKVQDDTKLVVTLSNVWAVSKDSELIYMSGGGFVIEYYRYNGTWTGKITQNWIQ